MEPSDATRVKKEFNQPDDDVLFRTEMQIKKELLNEAEGSDWEEYAGVEELKGEDRPQWEEKARLTEALKEEKGSDCEEYAGVEELKGEDRPQWEENARLTEALKEEKGSDCEEDAGPCGVSEVDAREGLYAGHEMKDEVVVGPEGIQPSVTLPAVHVKQELEEAADCEEYAGVTDVLEGDEKSEWEKHAGIKQELKEEGSDCEDADPCGVSEAAAIEGLYAGHEVKDELVLGPESIQPRDVTFPMQVKKELLNEAEESEWEQFVGAEELKEVGSNWENDVKVKEELKEESSGMETGVNKSKEEGSNCEAVPCAVTETAAGQEVKFEIVLGPEGIQLRELTRPVAAGPSASRSVRRVRAKNRKGAYNVPKRHPCDLCEYKFTDPSKLIIHKRTHTGEKPYSCDMCQHRVASRSALTSHKRIHTREKPYACSFCDMRFSQTGHVRRHEQTHTGEKPISCVSCDKKFATPYDMKTHARTHKNPYRCEICGRTFKGSDQLEKHKRTHMEDRPYSCTICNKSFRELYSLERHEETHSGDNRWICKICNKRLSSNTSLMRHTRLHSGEPNYSCSMCNKTFSTRSIVKKHELESCPKRKIVDGGIR